MDEIGNLTRPENSSSESEHDNITSPEPTTSTDRRQTRQTQKWYENTPTGFSPTEWETVKDNYNTLDKVEQRTEFNNQADELVKIYTEENIEQRLATDTNIVQIILVILRRAYRALYIYDIIHQPTDADIAKHTQVTQILTKIENYPVDHTMDETDNQENAGENDISEIDQLTHQLLDDLIKYVNSPHDPIWAKELDDAEVPDIIYVRKYIIDLSKGGLMKHDIKHYNLLLRNKDIKNILSQATTEWSKWLGSNTHVVAVAISEALNNHLTPSHKTQQMPSQQNQFPSYAQQMTETPFQEGFTQGVTQTINPNVDTMTQNHIHTPGINSSTQAHFGSTTGQMTNSFVPFQPTTHANMPSNNANDNPMQMLADVLQRIANQPHQSRTFNPKLPQIDVFKYDGSELEFIRWWDRYEVVIHKRTDLNPQQKLIYLQQFLTEKVQKFCWGASTATLTYDQAIKKVFEKYYVPNRLIDAYQQQIHSCSVPNGAHDTKGIRHWLDTTQQALSCLARFKVTPENISMAAMREIRMKFPKELLNAIAYNYRTKISDLNLEKFLNNLEEYIKVLEETDDYKKLTSEASSSSTTTMTTRQTPVAPRSQPKPAPRNLLPCIFCDAKAGEHTWRNCQKVKNPNERLKIFYNKKLCTCCGSSKHFWKNCMSQKSCRVVTNGQECGLKHHAALHEYFVGRNTESYNRTPPQNQIRANQNRQQAPRPEQSAPRPREPQQNYARPPLRDQNRGRTSMAHISGDQSQQEPEVESSNITTTGITTSTASAKPHLHLLGILQGKVSPPYSKHGIQGNIFLDEGSDTSYITEKMVRKLNLPIIGSKTLKVNAFGGLTVNKEYPITQARLSSKKGGQALVTLLVTDTITGALNTTGYTDAVKAFPTWNFPQVMENPFHIDILIGVDHLTDIRKGTIKLADSLEARQTILGPYIIGHIPNSKHNEEMITLNSAINSDPDPDEAILDSLVFAPFTEMNDNDTDKHELLEKLNRGTTLVDTPEGKLYQVPMLWTSEKSKQSLKPNFHMALAFLNKQFERMKTNGTISTCNKIIETAIQNGFYERCQTQTDKGHHIPHFFVENPNSTSTPIRHVIAGNMGKPAINEVLETGPSLIADLPTLLRQFRQHQTGIVADISKAFHRLVIKEEDRDYFKMLWYENGDKNKLITLRMARIPFGTCLAPFQLFGTLMHHLSKHDHPELVKKLYSDNLVTSVETDELQFALDTVNTFNSGGFKLCKFSTNSPTLQKELDEKELLNTAEKEITRVLGMCWKMKDDTLGWFKPHKTFDKDGVVTRRSMLKWLPSHWDPLGLLEGVTMPARAFQYQKEIYEKYDWDEPISQEDKEKFIPLAEEITKCMNTTIPRHHDFDPERKVRLHVFSDASVSWGGCCAYLTQDGKSTLVAGKAIKPEKRLEKNLTIPKRELCALVMGAEMINKLKQTYKDTYPELECHLYSDSQICLWQLANEHKPHKVFVKNRIKQIKELTNDIPKHYIETTMNPADALSRGMRAEEFNDKSSLFWQGPAIMHQECINPFKPEKELEDQMVAITLTTVSEKQKPSVLNLVKGSNTMAGKRLRLAAAIKAVRKWRKQPPLDARSLAREVTTALMKAEQEAACPEIIDYLKTKKGRRPQPVHPNQLFLDKSGLLRCGGRLGNSSMSFSCRFPLYYPANSPLIKERILEMHEIAKHAGPGVTRAKILQTLWIPKSSNTIRRILKSCYHCKRQTGKAFRWPKSPDLPTERVNVEPYNVIGCDLTGHFNVRNGTEIEKVYLAIFSCCSSRHISIEILDNMETETFLKAFRRHCSIYGTPSKIISDQGSYFVKSASVLGEKLGEEWCNEIAEKLNRKGIHWQFNPAGAPHFGGHFERLIGTLKAPLKRCIGRAVLDKQEFIVLCKEVACVMNDRPLTTTTHNHLKDRNAITPNHLIFGRPISPLPYGEDSLEDPFDLSFEPDDPGEVDRQWRRLALRLKLFKDQFATEYLAYLRLRHTIQHHDDPLEAVPINVGDLVIMKSDTEKRCLWEKAEVIEILPSSDGRVRAVKLRTKNGTTTRPIVKLFPLLSSKELRPNSSVEREIETRPPEPIQKEPVAPQDGATTVEAPTPPPRPQRAAKLAGRKKVQQWTGQLQND